MTIFENMKTLVRLLMLANFAAIVFIPNVYTSRLIMIPMFIVMIGLVALYWVTMFWVGRKDALKVLGKLPDYDFFVGKIPSDPQADLTRGRLCVTDGNLVLLQRCEKGRRTTPCRSVWEMETAKINSVGFGKVLPARKGFILYTADADEISFTCSKAAKDKALLYKALGWQMPQIQGRSHTI